MKIPIFPQNLSKICRFKILINYLKKSNGPNFVFLYFFILLDLFYDCANFRVNRSISCRDLRGGGANQPPPPPPMDSSPRNNPMGIGLIWSLCLELPVGARSLYHKLWGWGLHIVPDKLLNFPLLVELHHGPRGSLQTCSSSEAA